MNTKKLLVILMVSGSYLISSAQVTDAEKQLKTQRKDTVNGWKKGGLITVNLAQTSLTNWAAGGENSVAVNGLFSVFANYKNGNSAWDNSLDIGYGKMRQDKNLGFRKTDDKIDLLSKYGQKAAKNLYYAALLNLKTQMDNGYDYVNDTLKSKISAFMAPAYLIGALGMDYKPNNYFSAFLAPITGKVTFVLDQTLADSGAFGVKAATFDATGAITKHGEQTKKEFGGYIRMIYSRNDFKNELLKNVTFTTKIDLFSNYLDKPQNIDVNWETLIGLKVNKFLSVNINTQLIYDDNIHVVLDKNNDGVIDVNGPRTQFKEILGVGFSYKF